MVNVPTGHSKPVFVSLHVANREPACSHLNSASSRRFRIFARQIFFTDRTNTGHILAFDFPYLLPRLLPSPCKVPFARILLSSSKYLYFHPWINEAKGRIQTTLPAADVRITSDFTSINIRFLIFHRERRRLLHI